MRYVEGVVHEDGTASVLARMTSLDGTGEEQFPGEGNVLKQANINSISAKVYNLGSNKNNASGTEVLPAPTLTPAANVFDTLRVIGWKEDEAGYNFRHDVSATYLSDPNTWYLVEYKFVLASGGVAWLLAKMKTGYVRQS